MLSAARTQIVRHVNTTLINAYWMVGKYIVEFEQGGNARAEYGAGLLKRISASLVTEFGNAYNVTNLQMMRLLFLRIQNYDTLCHKLSWSHYRAILKVKNDAAMEYYINECAACNWSVRQLERQINTLYYERLLASRDKDPVRAEANTPKPGEVFNPREIVRDPYVLEFLLELGRGFTFVARQKRISFDNKHFYIDLVFYNILTRSYVLIDLKTDELTHDDLGQMQMYVNYYTRELMNPGDNPPIGILLCADKNDRMVEYTLPEGQKQIFAAKYMTYMPSKEELQELLEE